jgi:hypothetical protein
MTLSHPKNQSILLRIANDNLQGLSPKALKFWTNIIPLKFEKPMIKPKVRGVFSGCRIGARDLTERRNEK